MDTDRKRRLAELEKMLRIFCAALMLSLGFAHKPALAVSSQVVLDESYRLPDGTFAEICFGHGDGVNASHTKEGPAHSRDATGARGGDANPAPEHGSLAVGGQQQLGHRWKLDREWATADRR